MLAHVNGMREVARLRTPMAYNTPIGRLLLADIRQHAVGVLNGLIMWIC